MHAQRTDVRLKDARLIRLSIQRLAVNNIWSENDVLVRGSRQFHREKFAECLCIDEKANMFVEKLCVVAGFYWQESDKLAQAKVRPNLSKPVTVLCDRDTNRSKQKSRTQPYLAS